MQTFGTRTMLFAALFISASAFAAEPPLVPPAPEPAAAAPPDAEPSIEQQLLGELREHRRQMASVLLRLQKIEAQLEKLQTEEPAEAEDPFDGFPARAGQGPNRKELAKIKLPDQPTRQDCVEYITEIARLTRKQNRFSSTDPQTAMLRKIPSEHIDVLFDFMQGHSEFYVQQALQEMVRAEHKQIVIDKLAIAPQIVEIVVQHGWEKDAREVLVAELRARPQFLPTDWITAVANLSDPETYEDLKQYLILGENRYQTYQAIKHLPEIDLTDAVAEAWKRAQREEWEKRRFAPVAAEHGQLDALEFLIENLNTPEQLAFGRSYRTEVLRLIDFRGSNEEIDDWFRQNKARIYFDKTKKRFAARVNDVG